MSLPDYSVLASRLMAAGQWHRALEVAREWLAHEPENPRAHLAAGGSSISLGRDAEAARSIARALAALPESDLAHRVMSLIHARAGRFDGAGDSICKAIAIAPDNAGHWYVLARFCCDQGDLAHARKYAEKAQAFDPRDAAVVNLLATCSPEITARQCEAKREEYLRGWNWTPKTLASITISASPTSWMESILPRRRGRSVAPLPWSRALACSAQTSFSPCESRILCTACLLCLPTGPLMLSFGRCRRPGSAKRFLA
jgi:tetratricopeptide (TPR) repeat protein